MNNEVNVTIKSKYISQYKKGYPLIAKEALIDVNQLKDEGTIMNLHDERRQFIAKGYYGRQNKGYGWVLTNEKNISIDEQFFVDKLNKAIDKRKQLLNSEDTTAFRLFNGEGDGIGGLTIDYFAGYLLINWYSNGIYTFKDVVLTAIEKNLPYKGIYEKKRFDTKGQYIEDDDFVKGVRGEFPLIVKENGVNIAVYLNEGAMVGVFLDQRNVRKAIMDTYANGKTVLNTFSYTGAFSIFAALGGAKKTTSVDLANRSLKKTQEQFQINDIDVKQQEIIVEDVFKYFKYAVRKEKKFDLVILDPPSFARSKKFTFSASKDYTQLLVEAITITETSGTIIASTNCSTFNMKKFKTFIDKAFKETGGSYQIVEQHTLPEDFRTITEFPEGNYLKVVIIKKLS